MKNNILVTLSKEFAVQIINTFTIITKENNKYISILSQLLKSGTSIGANIHEGNYAASKADFINKFQIALKESYETDYWLEILKDSKILDEDKYNNLQDKCSKIRILLIKSIKTAKGENT